MFVLYRVTIVTLLVPSHAPNITEVRVLSSSSLQIVWTPPEDEVRDDNATEIIKYQIQWRLRSSARDQEEPSSKSDESEAPENSEAVGYEWESTELQANSSYEFLLENLRPFQDYEIRMAAGSKVGFGPYSEMIKERTKGDGKPFLINSR